MRAGDTDPVEQKGFSKGKTFPELLKYQRELRGWSQAKMAEEIGATPNRISSWERGVALPTAYFREKLCICLHMNAQELGLLAASKEVSLHGQEDEQPEEQTSVSPAKALDLLASSQQQLQDLPANTPRRFPARNRVATLLVLVGILLGCLLIISFYGSGVFAPNQANPYPPNTGHLVLNDVLRNQSSNMNWQEGANDQQASCVFKEGGYVAFQPRSGYFHACIAQNTDYTNFAYEVLMTIQQGEFGGIVFRAEDSIDAHYYVFRIGTDGSYWLYRFVDRTIEHAELLDHGSSQNFNRGLGKTNSLAVVAQGSSLTLYVNKQVVSALQDAGYTHGQIGVLAGSMAQGPSQALFRNVKVWAW